MTKQEIYAGSSPLRSAQQNIEGAFVHRDGMEYYKISNYDQMPPFFISVVSDSDHWLYTSSRGGLSAGRKNPGNA